MITTITLGPNSIDVIGKSVYTVDGTSPLYTVMDGPSEYDVLEISTAIRTD